MSFRLLPSGAIECDTIEEMMAMREAIRQRTAKPVDAEAPTPAPKPEKRAMPTPVKPAPLARLSCTGGRTEEELARNAEIKRLRMVFAWSQRKLAEEVGIKQRLISLIETGTAGCSEELLDRVRVAVDRKRKEMGFEETILDPAKPIASVQSQSLGRFFVPKRPAQRPDGQSFESLLADNPALAARVKVCPAVGSSDSPTNPVHVRERLPR
jgi:DNA-binding XRE family transcriptional regulator